MLGFNRGHLFRGLVATFCVFGVVSLLLIYFFSVQSSTIVMATGPMGGNYQVLFVFYRASEALGDLTELTASASPLGPPILAPGIKIIRDHREESMKKVDAAEGQSASELISNRIAELADWRGQTLARMRALILEADTEVVEEWKWMGTPVWSRDCIICTGESYKKVVKLTFGKGASLKDPNGLFNASLEGNTRRAIDIGEGESVDAAAFKALVREAIALNGARKSKPAKRPKSA